MPIVATVIGITSTVGIVAAVVTGHPTVAWGVVGLSTVLAGIARAGQPDKGNGASG